MLIPSGVFALSRLAVAMPAIRDHMPAPAWKERRVPKFSIINPCTPLHRVSSSASIAPLGPHTPAARRRRQMQHPDHDLLRFDHWGATWFGKSTLKCIGTATPCLTPIAPSRSLAICGEEYRHRRARWRGSPCPGQGSQLWLEKTAKLPVEVHQDPAGTPGPRLERATEPLIGGHMDWCRLTGGPMGA